MPPLTGNLLGVETVPQEDIFLMKHVKKLPGARWESKRNPIPNQDSDFCGAKFLKKTFPKKENG